MSGFWIRIAPTGCVYGSIHEESVGQLNDDAHKEFTPRIADRRREAAEGWRHELVSRHEWDRRAKPCLHGECRHPDYQGRTLVDVPTGEAL